MTHPATPDVAAALWPDADTIDPATLDQLLTASWSRCLAFLPGDVDVPGADPDTVVRWAHANVLDARELWTSYRRDGDVIGFETYAVRVRPLSDTVRALLRPQRGCPLVG